jgi:hypothetical protein
VSGVRDESFALVRPCSSLPDNLLTSHFSPPLHFALELKLLNTTTSAFIARLELTAVRFIDTVLFGMLPRVHFAILSLNIVERLVIVMKKLMVNLSIIWTRGVLPDLDGSYAP